MAVLFALFAMLASFGIGSAVQSSAMTGIITSNAPGVPTWGIGLAIVIMVSIVIFGGIKIISKVCEKLVPFMAIAYAWGCIVIIGMNWEYVWPAISLIFECAFTPKAAFGGAVGSGLMMALQFGCARGLFSNESGLGSAPIVASAASTRNPARQALVSMTGTFWDTVVICALTGIVLVSTMIANPGIMESGQVSAGADLTSAAFASIPYIGTPILVIGMILFAYTTILGWSYYGNRCVTYLFGKRAIRPYQVLYVVVAFLGPSASAIWCGPSPTSRTRSWPSRTSSWCCCFRASSRARRSITCGTRTWTRRTTRPSPCLSRSSVRTRRARRRGCGEGPGIERCRGPLRSGAGARRVATRWAQNGSCGNSRVRKRAMGLCDCKKAPGGEKQRRGAASENAVEIVMASDSRPRIVRCGIMAA